MGLFERYLTVWVGLGMLAGVGLGLLTPGAFQAIAALEAGKHVICEKPLAPTPAGIHQMIAARDKSGKLLMTAQHFRFQGASQAMKREIDGPVARLRLPEVAPARICGNVDRQMEIAGADLADLAGDINRKRPQHAVAGTERRDRRRVEVIEQDRAPMAVAGGPLARAGVQGDEQRF